MADVMTEQVQDENKEENCLHILMEEYLDHYYQYYEELHFFHQQFPNVNHHLYYQKYPYLKLQYYYLN